MYLQAGPQRLRQGGGRVEGGGDGRALGDAQHGEVALLAGVGYPQQWKQLAGAGIPGLSQARGLGLLGRQQVGEVDDMVQSVDRVLHAPREPHRVPALGVRHDVCKRVMLRYSLNVLRASGQPQTHSP